MSVFRIHAVTASALPGWRQMRQALWPEMTEEENLHETQAMSMADSRFLVRIASSLEGDPVGFVEASLRVDYVNGCVTSPVVFLEGIYVEPRARGQRVARSLIEAVEAWGRGRGCCEFASDALVENGDSHSMHRALGFEETERVVCFRKNLG